MEYNIYCDESCHLQHDKKRFMVIGAVYCPVEKKSEICKRIKDIKKRNGVPLNVEMKWVCINKIRLDSYTALVYYFFDDGDLRYRCIIADKTKLDHDKYHQSHDDWYYKMYFDMLKVILIPSNIYNIYIDVKDTHSYEKAVKLGEVLCNSKYDFSRKIIKNIQPIRSEEVEIMQLTDILTGAIAAKNNGDTSSVSKKGIISQIMRRSKYALTASTLYGEQKLNLFKWEADYGNKY